MGQGGAGALAAWAKQLGRSVRGGWVNECLEQLTLETQNANERDTLHKANPAARNPYGHKIATSDSFSTLCGCQSGGKFEQDYVGDH